MRIGSNLPDNLFMQIGRVSPPVALGMASTVCPSPAMSPPMRCEALRIITMMVKQYQETLQPWLPDIVELVVQTLDPRQGAARMPVAPLATASLRTFLRLLPNAAFHQVSLRPPPGSSPLSFPSFVSLRFDDPGNSTLRSRLC